MRNLAITLIISLVCLTNKVHALEYVKSGDSVKGLMKIGTKDIGSNYYYEVASGVWDQSTLSGSFQIDWHDIEEDVSDTTLKGTTYKNFVVEFCVNGAEPTFEIWSSYYNKVDYMYATNKRIYLAEGEWSYASCYRAFVSVYLNVQFSGGNSDINWYTYTPYNNKFAILGNDGFNKLIRYTDFIYYNNADYNALLEKTKTEQATIQQNNTIINQNQSIIDQNNQQIQQDKNQHDEFMNSDIPSADKEMPDDSKYQDYTDTEDNLKDKVNEADMSVISIGIDSNSSSFIWDTLTRLIQSNSIVFGMFIAILSIGILKLALGR